MPAVPDVLVVGAGVVGAAVAWVLARDGHSVQVVDESFAAGGTTAAGMGHIVVMDDSDAQFALTAWSRQLLDALEAELPASVELDRCGTLWIARTEAELDAARAKREYYTNRGVDAELLDARQLREAEPALAGEYAGALRVPGDSVVYPPGLAGWMLERAVSCGARVRTGTRIDAIDADGARSGGTRLPAGMVVNVAGAAAARLTPGLALVPRKGHLAITDRHPGICNHQLVELGYLASAHTMSGESVAFNLQPRKTGQVLIGSSRELVGWDPSINRSILRRMLERAVAFVPSLALASVIRVWTGFRPTTPDKLPLIGAWDETRRTWLATGHEGLGITMALGTAHLIADLIAGRQPALDPTPFAPRRKSALVEA